MSSYIGKIQVESGDQILIGSTLFGICSNAIDATAKTVTLSSFDSTIKGVTVHVRFLYGNNVTSGLTLAVGSTAAQPIVGNCVCNANDIVAFTYYEEVVNETLVKGWYVNSNVVVSEGSANGQIKVNGQNVSVHGLNSAAYSSTSAFATSAQGTLADNAMPKSGGTFTGAVTLSGAPSSDLQAATKKYVDDKTAGLSGLTGAMHYKGISSTTITDGGTQNPTVDNTEITTKEAGDVVLYGNQEYVWNGNTWELLGDEGSYALKTNTASVIKSVTFTQNTLPVLTTTAISIPNITNAGSAPSLSTTAVSIPNVTDAGQTADFSVTSGVLVLSRGSTPTLGTAISVTAVTNWNQGSIPTLGTAISVTAVADWSAGSQASLSSNDQTVVIP